MPNNRIIMPLKDGGLLDVIYSSEDDPGCPTCDYGSSYVDDFTLDLTTMSIDVHINMMYSHLIREAWLMRQLLSADHGITEEEFSDWFKAVMDGRFAEEWYCCYECFGEEDRSSYTLYNKETKEVRKILFPKSKY